MKLNLLVINTLTIAVIYINGDNELLHDTKMLVTFMPSVAIPYPIQNGLTFRKGDMSTSSHTVGSRDEGKKQQYVFYLLGIVVVYIFLLLFNNVNTPYCQNRNNYFYSKLLLRSSI